MRLFIGIQFNTDVKNYLQDVQSKIKHCANSGNYTLNNNFHITLRFIGEVKESEVDFYYDILDELRNQKSFPIKIGDISSFKKNNRHLVYVEVIKNKNLVVNLASELDKIIDEKIGSKREQKFKPHITIIRNALFSDISATSQITPFAHEIMIESVSLMLSNRNKQNILTYTPLYTVTLNGKL